MILRLNDRKGNEWYEWRKILKQVYPDYPNDFNLKMSPGTKRWFKQLSFVNFDQNVVPKFASQVQIPTLSQPNKILNNQRLIFPAGKNPKIDTTDTDSTS